MLPVPKGYQFDGVSLRKILEKGDQADWPDRMLVTDSQRVRDPIKWKQSAVMSQGWRLVNGKELYDIDSDPGQEKDVSANHPERVKEMRAFYDAWWAELGAHLFPVPRNCILDTPTTRLFPLPVMTGFRKHTHHGTSSKTGRNYRSVKTVRD